MPCTPAKARHLLEAGKAKCIRRTPFTIKLLWDCEENLQEVVGGMDTGSKTIGCAAIANGKVVYQSEVQLRSDISRKMEQRRMFRRTRRGRKTRYRKPRFLNRGASIREGRLPPSIRSKIESHLREKKFVESILPISRWKVETTKFDTHKITNPDVKGKEYQEGSKKGFYNIKSYVLDRDGYKCQKCKKKNLRLEVHHIIFRSQGGTNEPKNLITLCSDCHSKLHNGDFNIKGSKSKTKHSTQSNIITSQLRKRFGSFEETFGYETKYKREQFLELPKEHYYDAVAICCEEGEYVKPLNNVLKKKCVSKGDYKQTKGKRSEIKIPTGKLFGFRKFDLIKTPKGIGFIKGKRSRGCFEISNLNNSFKFSIYLNNKCYKIKSRSTILLEREALI